MGESVMTACHILNRTGPCPVEGKTPWEAFTGKSANIDKLKVFGTECMVWIPKQKRKKFDARAWKGIFVGYEDCGYRV